MTAELYTAVISGATVVQAGSQTVAITLLCGVSGTAVIPLQVLSDGSLIVSGA